MSLSSSERPKRHISATPASQAAASHTQPAARHTRSAAFFSAMQNTPQMCFFSASIPHPGQKQKAVQGYSYSKEAFSAVRSSSTRPPLVSR